jgi:hypothetical protein
MQPVKPGKPYGGQRALKAATLSNPYEREGLDDSPLLNNEREGLDDLPLLSQSHSAVIFAMCEAR